MFFKILFNYHILWKLSTHSAIQNVPSHFGSRCGLTVFIVKHDSKYWCTCGSGSHTKHSSTYKLGNENDHLGNRPKRPHLFFWIKIIYQRALIFYFSIIYFFLAKTARLIKAIYTQTMKSCVMSCDSRFV